MYSYRYTDGDLEKLRRFCDDVDEAYVLFNNVAMYEDAMRFLAMLGQRPEGARDGP